MMISNLFLRIGFDLKSKTESQLTILPIYNSLLLKYSTDLNSWYGPDRNFETIPSNENIGYWILL